MLAQAAQQGCTVSDHPCCIHTWLSAHLPSALLPAAWMTPKREFLPRQLGRLDEHPLLDLLNMSHNRFPFFYHCPRWQRRRRLGPWGIAPRDVREEELERQAEANIAARLGYAPPRPSSSAPASSSLMSVETLSDSGTATATEPAVAEEPGPAAASGQRAPKPAGGRGRGRGSGGTSGRGRGRAAAAAGGLSLLNAAGRPKFYHSRTCVAMTQQELFGEAGQAGSDESDSEGDLAEWQASQGWCVAADVVAARLYAQLHAAVVGAGRVGCRTLVVQCMRLVLCSAHAVLWCASLRSCFTLAPAIQPLACLHRPHRITARLPRAAGGAQGAVPRGASLHV